MTEAPDDRTATREEVLAGRQVLHRLAGEHGLVRPRVDAVGVVVVGCTSPGYAAVRSYATAAAQALGVPSVNVVTDDAPGASVDTTPL